MKDAYGLDQGDTFELCLPSTPIAGGMASICADTSCNGEAGCPMTAHIGMTQWTVAASNAAGATDVTVDTVVTDLTGDVGVTGLLNCVLKAVVPTAGLGVIAKGIVPATIAQAGERALEFRSLTAPLDGFGVSSTDSDCQDAANANLAAALPNIRVALLEAFNARAQSLRCQACRGDCPQQLACVER